MSERKSTTRYLLCVENEGYAASLERRKIYRRLPDARAASHGLIRIVDESGEDYLYPKAWFVPIAAPRTAARAFA
jgi:hypothetical protein